MPTKMDNFCVSDSVSKLYLHSDTADVHFAFSIGVENVKVPAHKSILAITSPVFDAMFFGKLKENDIVEMVDCDADAFKEFLQLFYLSRVTISLENIESVVRLADKYDVLKRLNSFAKQFEKKLKKENVIWGYKLAILLKQPRLTALCESLIQSYASDVLNSDMFRQCDKEIVESILEMYSLNSSESDIFKACVKWAESSCEINGLDNSNASIVREQLGKCFYLIRFGAMTSAEIGFILSNKKYNDLFSRDELVDIFGNLSNKDFEFQALKDSQRLLRPFKWIPANVLTYTREAKTTPVNVLNRESTWLSSNVRLLFGTVRVVRLSHNENVFFYSNMYIIEYEEQQFSPKNPCKVLHVQRVNVSSRIYGFIPIPQPIMIHPDKMYEIRFESSSPPNDCRKRNYSWKPEINLAEGVTLKFHRNPFEPNNDQRGLVYQLRFSLF